MSKKAADDLLNKRVKIGDHVYDVQSQTVMDGTDIIVLSRELPKTTIETIYDMGYASEDDIIFRDSEIQACKIALDDKVSSAIELASISKSGRIRLSKCFFLGLSILDPKKAKVFFIDEMHPDKDPVTQTIDFDILVDAVLMAEKFKEMQPEVDTEQSVFDSGKDTSDTRSTNDDPTPLKNDEDGKLSEGIRKMLKNRAGLKEHELFGEGFDTVFKDLDILFSRM